MKAYIAAVLVAIALISAALATTLGPSHIQNHNNNVSQQTHIERPDAVLLDAASVLSSGMAVGTINVSLGTVIQEAIATALLAIGSIAVLRKK
jgi:hypothetical protein